MTAGVIGRLPRVGLIVCAIGSSRPRSRSRRPRRCRPAAPAAAPVAAKPEPLSSPTSAGRPTSSRRARSSRGASPGACRARCPATLPTSSSRRRLRPGTRVIADGAPTVVLRLSRNGAYEQEGVPENVSPYAGKPARLVGAAQPKRKPAQAAARRAHAEAARSRRRRRATPKPRGRPPASLRSQSPVLRRSRSTRSSLSARAKQLAAWVEKHRGGPRANVDHWLYQHNWIVTGAAFGWANGAEALRTLIAVDKRVQKLWGIGAQSERSHARPRGGRGEDALRRVLVRLLREQRGYSLMELLVPMTSRCRHDLRQRPPRQRDQLGGRHEPPFPGSDPGAARARPDAPEVHCASRSARRRVGVGHADDPGHLPDVGRQHRDHVVHGRERAIAGASGATGRTAAAKASDTPRSTAASIFTYMAQTVDKLAFLNVRLPVNVKPSEPRFLYDLTDDIVLRNSTRS